MSATMGQFVVAAIMMASGLTYGATNSTLALVIDAVVHKGPAAELPAHLSMVLGIATAQQPVPVKQAVLRQAATVRTFNVCTNNHDNVVMVTYDEQSRSTKAYLVNAAGTLRKAVAYQAGEAPTVRTMSESRGDFTQELAFWTKFQHGVRPPPGIAAPPRKSLPK